MECRWGKKCSCASKPKPRGSAAPDWTPYSSSHEAAPESPADLRAFLPRTPEGHKRKLRRIPPRNPLLQKPLATDNRNVHQVFLPLHFSFFSLSLVLLKSSLLLSYVQVPECLLHLSPTRGSPPGSPVRRTHRLLIRTPTGLLHMPTQLPGGAPCASPGKPERGGAIRLMPPGATRSALRATMLCEAALGLVLFPTEKCLSVTAECLVFLLLF